MVDQRLRPPRPRHLVAGAVVQLLAVVPASPAAAQAPPSSPPTTASCQFERVLCSGLGTPGAAGPQKQEPRETRDPGRPKSKPRSAPPVYARQRTYIESELGPRGPARASGQTLVAPGSGFCVDPATGQRGVAYIDEVVNRQSGEVVSSRDGCEVRGRPRTPTPRAEPELPVPREIWERVPLPLPEWGLNPSGKGLTGLQTWLWDPNGGAPVSATVTLDAFTATATARPVRWEWRMWDRGDTPNVNPHPVVVSTSPGSEERPAGKYMYETNGEYTLTHTVVWTGSYTLSGPGVSETVDLGTTTTSSSRRYQVISVRGARIG